MVKNLFFVLVMLIATLPVMGQERTVPADWAKAYCQHPKTTECQQLWEKWQQQRRSDAQVQTQTERAVTDTTKHSTTVAGHTFGETFEQWMSKEGINLDYICSKGAPKDMHRQCKELSTFSGNGTLGHASYSTGKLGDLDRELEILKRGGSVAAHNFQWSFRNGKLSEAVVEIPGPDLNAEFGHLEQTYGEPTKVDTSTFTNAMGGKWDCREEHWVMPDGAIINAMDRVIMGSQIGVFHDLTIYFKSKEAVTNMIDEYKDKNKANPY